MNLQQNLRVVLYARFSSDNKEVKKAHKSILKHIKDNDTIAVRNFINDYVKECDVGTCHFSVTWGRAIFVTFVIDTLTKIS